MPCGWSARGGQTQSPYVKGGWDPKEKFGGHSVRISISFLTPSNSNNLAYDHMLSFRGRGAHHQAVQPVLLRGSLRCPSELRLEALS